MQNMDLFFLLLGAILVLAMHAGFAFLELGTVRHKNQVNALSKILTDFSISALVNNTNKRPGWPPDMSRILKHTIIRISRNFMDREVCTNKLIFLT